jgi:hypothetical protein
VSRINEKAILLKIANKSIENVEMVKSLGQTPINQNYIHQKLKRRLNSETACHSSVQNPLYTRILALAMSPPNKTSLLLINKIWLWVIEARYSFVTCCRDETNRVAAGRKSAIERLQFLHHILSPWYNGTVQKLVINAV